MDSWQIVDEKILVDCWINDTFLSSIAAEIMVKGYNQDLKANFDKILPGIAEQ